MASIVAAFQGTSTQSSVAVSPTRVQVSAWVSSQFADSTQQ